MWGSVKGLARGFEYLMALVIFTPVAIAAWFPFVSDFQTRLLYNQAFSRGLQIQRILSGGKKNEWSHYACYAFPQIYLLIDSLHFNLNKRSFVLCSKIREKWIKPTSMLSPSLSNLSFCFFFFALISQLFTNLFFIFYFQPLINFTRNLDTSSSH